MELARKLRLRFAFFFLLPLLFQSNTTQAISVDSNNILRLEHLSKGKSAAIKPGAQMILQTVDGQRHRGNYYRCSDSTVMIIDRDGNVASFDKWNINKLITRTDQPKRGAGHALATIGSLGTGFFGVVTGSLIADEYLDVGALSLFVTIGCAAITTTGVKMTRNKYRVGEQWKFAGYMDAPAT